MFLRWRMTTNPFTVSPSTTVPEAVELMQTNNVRKLPVVSHGRLVGVVSQSDIDRASPSRATSFSAGELIYLISKLKVSQVMTADPITIGPDALLDEAAILMRDNKIEILPVVENGELIGVITESDLLEAFVELNGARTHGTRFIIEADDQPGVMRRLSTITSEVRANITHIAVYRSGMDRSLVVLGVNTLNTEELEKLISEAGFTIKYQQRNE